MWFSSWVKYCGKSGWIFPQLQRKVGSLAWLEIGYFHPHWKNKILPRIVWTTPTLNLLNVKPLDKAKCPSTIDWPSLALFKVLSSVMGVVWGPPTPVGHTSHRPLDRRTLDPHRRAANSSEGSRSNQPASGSADVSGSRHHRLGGLFSHGMEDVRKIPKFLAKRIQGCLMLILATN